MSLLGAITGGIVRAFTGVATLGGSEIIRAATGGGRSTPIKLLEGVSAPGATPETAFLAPIVAGAAAGFFTKGFLAAPAATGAALLTKEIVDFPIAGRSTSTAPQFRGDFISDDRFPGPGRAGGPPTFTSFSPFETTGRNPAWLSSGRSVRLSIPSSVSRRGCQGPWVASGRSVRRSCNP